MGGSQSADKFEYKSPPAEELVTYEGKGPFWNCDVDAEMPIRMSQSGLASEAPTTVMAKLQDAVLKKGDTEALCVERAGVWKKWTWNEYSDDIFCAARAFVALGLEPFQAVNIIGFNSPEWFIANVAAIACHGKAAGIYTTNGPEACKYITEHSEAAFVVCENNHQLAKFLQIRDELPQLKGLIMWDGELPDGCNVEGKVPVYTWERFMAIGKQGLTAEDAESKGQARTMTELQAEVDKRVAATKPGHCSTLIYTSGTTGNPKAVMISNDNICWTAGSLLKLMPQMGEQSEHIVSYLPLSHVAAQMLDIHSPISLAASGIGATVWFARPDALKGTLGDTLKVARPTFFFGVPRVWEKIAEKMKKIGAKTTGFKKIVASWAKNKGAQKYKAQQVHAQGSVPSGAGIADSLVFSKIKQALGFDRTRMCMTGAAPISKETLNYWGQLDIHIIEIYGMSECSGPQNTGRYNYFQAGSCGVPIPGAEIKLDHKEDRDPPGEGEICYRGRHIMMGYMKNPTKTQEAIDPEGWLHSGDVGRIDDKGLLYITGRIKELIITAGGENVAPVPMEDAVKAELSGISNIMMVGDKRKYNTCLVTLKQVADLETGEFKDELTGEALDVSPDSKTVTQAMADPKWQAYIEAGIKAANAKAVSRASKIQKFRILPVDFGVPTGELTATLKLKRPVVAKKYNDVIEEMYNEPAPAKPAAAPEAAPEPAPAAAPEVDA